MNFGANKKVGITTFWVQIILRGKKERKNQWELDKMDQR